MLESIKEKEIKIFFGPRENAKVMKENYRNNQI